MRNRGVLVAAVAVAMSGVPSRADIKPVAVSIETNASGTYDLGVPLAGDTGCGAEIFVVTSWTSTSSGSGTSVWLESNGEVKDGNIAREQNALPIHHFTPGIVFPRRADGQSDSQIRIESSQHTTISLHGYTTHPGQLFGHIVLPPIPPPELPPANAISPLGMAILAGLLGATGMLVMRRKGVDATAA